MLFDYSEKKGKYTNKSSTIYLLLENTSMSLKICLGDETFFTMCARKWSLPCVTEQMSLKVDFLSKRFRAQIASERSFSGVGSLMGLEVCGNQSHVWTVRTLVLNNIRRWIASWVYSSCKNGK